MKLVKIEHVRCGEYDGTEYALAPDDWSEEKIRATVGEVRQQATADAGAIKKPPFGEPSYQPDYSANPDKTVAEVERDHAEHKAKYAAWRDENKQLTKDFGERLRDVGFVGLWEDGSGALEVKVNWGHSHGLKLPYKSVDW